MKCASTRPVARGSRRTGSPPVEGGDDKVIGPNLAYKRAPRKKTPVSRPWLQVVLPWAQGDTPMELNTRLKVNRQRDFFLAALSAVIRGSKPY